MLLSKERKFGPDHQATLETRTNIAALLIQQGHYEEAKLAYECALGSCERVFGLENSLTLNVLNQIELLSKYEFVKVNVGSLVVVRPYIRSNIRI